MGAHVCRSSRAHIQKQARVDETSMHGKHFLNLQAQLQPPSDLGEQLNTQCGGSEIANAFSGVQKSG